MSLVVCHVGKDNRGMGGFPRDRSQEGWAIWGEEMEEPKSGLEEMAVNVSDRLVKPMK